MSRTFIYSRVSTDDQSTDAQLCELRGLYQGAETVEEKASGAKSRPKLDALIASLTSGDRLVIYSLDRLGRRAGELVQLIESLVERGVVLISKREGIDFSTPTGELVATIFAGVAQFERKILSERTKAGLKAARARGSQIGAVAKISRETNDRILSAVKAGMPVKFIARAEKISRGHVYRILNKAKKLT